MKPKRNIPITKQLSNKFGGKWRYIPFNRVWVCDELDTHACYMAEGGYDVNGEYIPVPYLFSRLTIFGLEDRKQFFYPNK